MVDQYARTLVLKLYSAVWLPRIADLTRGVLAPARDRALEVPRAPVLGGRVEGAVSSGWSLIP